MKKLGVKSFVTIGMLSSLSFILMLVKFPIPPFPPYLTVDFSDIPAIIAALMFGPIAAILVELFKNILDYFITGSGTGIPIGHIANFLAGILFVLPTYYVFKVLKAKWGLMISLIVGTIFMAVFMSIFNYFVLLPAYIGLLGWEPMSNAALRKMVVASILPFNVVKGIIITIVFILLYSRLGSRLNKNMTVKNV
ncbi:ECF transporter S component [Lederbergia wuyishanensis]|uniref:Riboflavin transporter n=1 Tax=Lederbergia wuyishanensis TaxID=1347903 RepID=A0ABU0D118_9BACI|nr:ECF transporter S component [Lederbergia wuyishanensis]MCJ8006709.1 ECF transporter S component [Lederbergia wuyishanensis]MDQ0342091.1 riboflavin transporter FmnP [Lederbergia wuyishanensis]